MFVLVLFFFPFAFTFDFLKLKYDILYCSCFVLLLMVVFMIYSFQNLSCRVISKLLGYVTCEQGLDSFHLEFLTCGSNY